MAVPYKVEYIGQTLQTLINPVVDISNNVQSIDSFKIGTTGVISEATIVLNTNYGFFITQTDNNKTPIISRRDFMRVTLDDGNDSNSKIMYVSNKNKQHSSHGKLLSVSLLGRESFLKEQKITGRYYFIKVIDMIREILSQYNENAIYSNLIPEIRFGPTTGSEDYLKVPSFPTQTFDWTENGTNLYDALLKCLDLLELPGSAGGAGDLFELVFDDNPADDNIMFARIFSQGDRPDADNTITIDTKDSIQVTGSEPIENANVTVVRGAQDKGRFPRELDTYRSGLEFYQSVLDNQLWISTESYPVGTYVSYEDDVYQCILIPPSGTLPTNSTYWSKIEPNNFIGDINYSPWTNYKAEVWRNSFGDPGGRLDPGDITLTEKIVAAYDGNLVIRDVTHRDWADFIGTSLTDIPDTYLYPSGSSTRLYEGMRIFIKDAPTGTPFTNNGGKDKFGKSYQGKIAQYGADGDWIVISRDPQSADEVIVTSTGQIFYFGKKIEEIDKDPFIEYEGVTEWREITNDQFLGKDIAHYPDIIENVKGLIANQTKPNGDDYTDMSGLRIRYKSGTFVTAIGLIAILGILFTGGRLLAIRPLLVKLLPLYLNFHALSILTLTELQNIGWWAMLEFPFPKCTLNGITENVGELYGGTTESKIPFLDVENERILYDGKKGFFNNSSDTFGELTGITFLFNFKIYHGNAPGFEKFDAGNFPFSIFIYDIHSNVVRATFNYRFENETQRIIIPFSEFTSYRARSPTVLALLSPDPLSAFTSDRELYNQNHFQWRKIKRISIVYDLSYDDKGSYNPYTAEKILSSLGTVVTGNVYHDGTIDAFGFMKAPISIAKQGTAETKERILMTNIKEYPIFDNILQLNNLAKGDLQLESHIKKTFEYKGEGKCDLKVGQSVNLKGNDFVTNEDGITENIIKLVVDEINYSVSPDGNASGFIRNVYLARRINA